MDQFHKIMIREKNPAAPGLAELLEDREADFKAKVASMTISPGLLGWQTRMKKKFGEVQVHCGADVIMGHLPVDFITALLMQRYGHTASFWPAVFAPDDMERALGWEKGAIPSHAVEGNRTYLPPIVAGGAELTDYMEAQLGNGLFRTGLTTITTRANSAAVSLGDIIKPTTFADTLFQVTTAGTLAGSPPTFNTTIGDLTTDGSAVLMAVKVGIVKRAHFIALFTAAPGETGGGTEVTGGSYARVKHSPTDANWTVSTAAGAAGRNDNALAITFPAPTANWGVVTDMAILEKLTAGNMIMFSPLTVSKTVNNADPAPNFAVGALDIDFS